MSTQPKRGAGRVFLDSFSGAAADLPKGKRTDADILAALAKSPRVSTFDMSEHAWLRGSIAYLTQCGLITEDKSAEYPWHRFTLTAAGRATLPHITGERA